MKKILIVFAAISIGACSSAPRQHDAALERINQELDSAAQSRAKPATAEAVSQALLPPLVVQMPRPDAGSLDPRFDLNVNGAPANQVFQAIVSGTRYSMIVHPDVKAPISVNLKGVTVFEALDTIRELYGYEYRIQDTRISIQPVTMQTRVFQVNYLQATRSGRTDVRVSSGSLSDSPTAGTGGVPGSVTPSGQPASPAARLTDSTRVTTKSDSDFWSDITKSLVAVVGTAEGRHVIVNPQSGVIVVRALPAELRGVESFLKAMQLVVERQVVLEAKIIEVTLREGFEAGINWGAFNNTVTAGVIRPQSTIGTSGVQVTPTTRAPDGSPLASSTLATSVGAMLAGGGVPGGVFGLALQTNNFAALLTFLETQGSLNVLSSPRVATINNQKAVLKVGTDEFFVTNISTTATTSGTGTITSPTITVQPFFSGIALDVTPQIDDGNNIILHIHPTVSNVIEKNKTIDLGSQGVFILPLASSTLNETDTVVRVQDSNIVAIGGLMRQQSSKDRNQLPGIGDAAGIGDLFRQRSNSSVKSELVILLKPTIIHNDRNWEQDIIDTRARVRAMQPPQQ
jgi:MSHA biogenesis protein MshL